MLSYFCASPKGGDYAGHDNFPECYFRKAEADNDGVKSLDRDDYEKAKLDFYALCQWDKDTGAPTRRVLEKYDLKDIADQLEKKDLLPS